MSTQKKKTGGLVKGQKSMFSFFSKAAVPLKSKQTIRGDTDGGDPTPSKTDGRPKKTTPETLTKVKESTAKPIERAKRSFNEYLELPRTGTQIKVYDAQRSLWLIASIKDFREDEGTHLLKYAEDGATEWITLGNEKYEVLSETDSTSVLSAKKAKTSPAKSSVASAAEKGAQMGKNDPQDSPVIGRRSSRRRAASKKPKYVFSDSDDDDDDEEEDDDEAVPAKKSAKRKPVVVNDDDDDDNVSEEEYTLSGAEASSSSSSDDDPMDVDDDFIVDDDVSEVDATLPKKRKAAAPKKNASRARRDNRSADPSSSAIATPKASPTKEYAFSFSRTGTGQASIMSRRTAAKGSPPSDQNGKQTYEFGEHWHDYQKWLHEDRRDGRGRTSDDPCFDPRTILMPSKDWDKKIAVNGGKLTPAQKQWWDFKRNNFDCVLFFKVGKFYELFHMDADVGVKELSVGANPMIFMAGAQGHSGFPEISYGKFANILVEKGYRVMRIEQTERPDALAEWNKGKSAGQKRHVVRRSICAVLTPGTRTNGTMDGPWAQNAAQSILLAISERPLTAVEVEESGGTSACEYGVFFGDSQTSSFRVGQFVDDKQRNRLRTLLSSIRPREVVFPKAAEGTLGGLSEATHSILKAESHTGMVMTGLNVSGQAWGIDKTLAELKKQFDIIHQHEKEDEVQAPFNVRQKQTSGDPLWRWPGILHDLAVVEGTKVVPAGRCELAIHSIGNALQHMQRCLVDTQILEKGTFYPYVPVDMQESDNGIVALSRNSSQQDSNAATSDLADMVANGGDANKLMVLDSHCLRNLEIHENSHDKSIKGSLLEFLDHTMTPYGRRLFHSWVMSPLYNISKINARLDAVEVLMDAQESVCTARNSLRGIKYDLERLLSSVHTLGSRYLSRDHPMAEAIMYEEDKYLQYKTRDFGFLLKGLNAVSELIKDIAAELKNHGGDRSKLLLSILPIASAGNADNTSGAYLERSTVDCGVGLGMASRSVEHTGCVFPADLDMLLQATNEDFPGVDQCKEIKPRPGTDPRYEELLRKKKEIREELEAFLVTAKQTVCKTATYWGSGKNNLQIEVPETVKVPSNWTFNSKKKGFKRFYTKETLALKQALEKNETETEERCRDALRLIFRRFSRHYDKWMAAIQCVAQLDALMSLALASEKSREGADGMMDLPVCRPEFVEPAEDGQPLLELRQARHPCVAKTFSRSGFISNDTILGAPFGSKAERSTSNPSGRVMLLTGPNMGGKSTLLRQTCICVIMAQLGCHVPAEKFALTPVDRIFTRIGASDRILEGQSTFFVELSETATILNHATSRSLVILDELGRGTSTFDGVAIAAAVVEKLCKDIRCRVMFATHYHSLIEEFRGHPDVSLGNMSCKLQESSDHAGAKVLFLYQILAGSCNDSYGLNVARLAKLPLEILQRAHSKSKDFFDTSEVRTQTRLSAMSLLHDVAKAMKRKEAGDDISETLVSLMERAKRLVV